MEIHYSEACTHRDSIRMPDRRPLHHRKVNKKKKGLQIKDRMQSIEMSQKWDVMKEKCMRNGYFLIETKLYAQNLSCGIGDKRIGIIVRQVN